MTNIRNSRGQNRRQFYQDLVKVSGQTYGYGCQALESAAGWQGIESEVILQQLRHYLDLLGRVIDQTDRRVCRARRFRPLRRWSRSLRSIATLSRPGDARRFSVTRSF